MKRCYTIKISVVCVLLIFLVSTSFNSDGKSLRICSWNIRDFGKSKDETEIEFIANTLRDFDIVLIQEVVAGDGGAQAVAKLNDVLNRKGAKWEYCVSEPTFGDSYKTERYGFLWKTSKIKQVGKAWLEQKYKVEIDREPYYSTFTIDDKQFTLVNFHAITKSKQPETEIKYFKFLPAEYPNLNLIFCGDFNLPQSHTVFNPLKSMGYFPAFENQKTTLRHECKGEDCLASEFDNIFYRKAKIGFERAEVIHFYKSFPSLKDANKISDHVPITVQFHLN